MSEPRVTYPKRLIEVDLPIKAISAHARREKSIRHGHISTMHIWWARRPSAACRAVLCASLWPDPADELCPEAFRTDAARILSSFAEQVRTDRQVAEICASHWLHWRAITTDTFKAKTSATWLKMRGVLLDFIADFANWDASIIPSFVDTARALTAAAHQSMGDNVAERPTVIDPFAGGGTIPLEVLRIGAEAYASDLNPVAVLLNKVLLDYIPRWGSRLSDEVRKWGAWIRQRAERDLGGFYPSLRDGSHPLAYLWARTIRCEGPACNVEIPMVRSAIIAKRPGRRVLLEFTPNKKKTALDIQIDEGSSAPGGGTVRLGSVTCPSCGYTTDVGRIRTQLATRRGGAHDARLLCIVGTRDDASRSYQLPSRTDIDALRTADGRFEELRAQSVNGLSLVPDESTPPDGTGGLGGGYRTRKYGILSYGDFFTARQAVALSTFIAHLKNARREIDREHGTDLASAVTTCLALVVDRCVDYWSSSAMWAGDFIAHTFGRQALPIVWDFAEANPFSGGSGDWDGALEWVAKVCDTIASARLSIGHIEMASADAHPLPDNAAHAVITDPPYYDSVPYGELSDFFFVWLKRAIGDLHPLLFSSDLVLKDRECVVNLADTRPESGGLKDKAHFENTMRRALTECRRVTRPDGVAVIVFAHKSTAGWETQIQAIVDAGWVLTASWPIDTERPGRLRANNSAALASSVHLVCRPREKPDGSLRMDDIGDWRDVLSELPKRIHEWMPRLSKEGVVGADAIFACLGPALEIFSRYSKVEDAAGNEIKLKTYLEKVWEAVAKEALSVIFSGADAVGFEPDARLTAMWLWTLFSASSSSTSHGAEDEDADEDNEDDVKKAKPKMKGFSLEYDAARKIAQGLGADLEKMSALVEVKGETARLLSVDERRKTLFGKGESEGAEAKAKSTKKKGQLGLGFTAPDEERSSDVMLGISAGPVQPGQSVLDRVHQAMILFGANQAPALKRFLVENQVGKDDRFWSLAQHLSALYPASSSEKRLVDGVLSRKKGLGF